MLFIAVGILAFAFSLLAGMFLTADCLSEEKREGTLGLLFLTPLKGHDVVFGKLIATSLHAFYGLLAILPLLALPLLMGGVTLGEFWRVNLVLVTTLFLSLAMGMFVFVTMLVLAIVRMTVLGRVRVFVLMPVRITVLVAEPPSSTICEPGYPTVAPLAVP